MVNQSEEAKSHVIEQVSDYAKGAKHPVEVIKSLTSLVNHPNFKPMKLTTEMLMQLDQIASTIYSKKPSPNNVEVCLRQIFSTSKPLEMIPLAAIVAEKCKDFNEVFHPIAASIGPDYKSKSALLNREIEFFNNLSSKSLHADVNILYGIFSMEKFGLKTLDFLEQVVNKSVAASTFSSDRQNSIRIAYFAFDKFATMNFSGAASDEAVRLGKMINSSEKEIILDCLLNNPGIRLQDIKKEHIEKAASFYATLSSEKISSQLGASAKNRFESILINEKFTLDSLDTILSLLKKNTNISMSVHMISLIYYSGQFEPAVLSFADRLAKKTSGEYAINAAYSLFYNPNFSIKDFSDNNADRLAEVFKHIESKNLSWFCFPAASLIANQNVHSLDDYESFARDIVNYFSRKEEYKGLALGMYDEPLSLLFRSPGFTRERFEIVKTIFSECESLVIGPALTSLGQILTTDPQGRHLAILDGLIEEKWNVDYYINCLNALLLNPSFDKDGLNKEFSERLIRFTKSLRKKGGGYAADLFVAVLKNPSFTQDYLNQEFTDNLVEFHSILMAGEKNVSEREKTIQGAVRETGLDSINAQTAERILKYQDAYMKITKGGFEGGFFPLLKYFPEDKEKMSAMVKGMMKFFPLFKDRDDAVLNLIKSNPDFVKNIARITETLDAAEMVAKGLGANADDAFLCYNLAYSMVMVGEENTKMLYRDLGISNFLRYSPSLLNEIAANMDSTRKRDKPLLLVMAGTYDWNGALYQTGNVLGQLTRHYRVIVAEVSTKKEFFEKMAVLPRAYGKIDTLVISAHGDVSSIDLGGSAAANRVDISDKESLGALKNAFAGTKQPHIILDACSTGKHDRGIAAVMANEVGAELIAPVYESSAYFELNRNGSIRNVLYTNPIKRVFRPGTVASTGDIVASRLE